MSFKKHIAIAALLAFSLHAHATNYGGNSGAGHGARAGATAGSGAVGQSAAQSGSSGGRYQWANPDASLVDRYQPYAEADVRQYQKP